MSASTAGTATSVPEIRVHGAWPQLLEGTARAALETDALPRYLSAQRWFGGKARHIAAVRLDDWAPLDGDTAAVFLTVARVEFADGGKDFYLLPLAITAGAPAALPAAAIIARLVGPDGTGVLHDALIDPGVCIALLDAVGRNRRLDLRGGTVRGVATSAFAALRGGSNEAMAPRLGPATSSNSLVFFGDRLLLKVFRRLENGTNPDLEIGRFLTEAGKFHRVPRVAGALEYERAGRRTTLAIVQEWVAHEHDGWQHGLGEVGRYLERVAADGAAADQPQADERSLLTLAQSAAPAAVAAAVGPYLQTAGLLGRRTAELHLALAGRTDDPAFRPEAMTAADLDDLLCEVRYQAQTALDVLPAAIERLPADVQAEARRLADGIPAFCDALHTDLEALTGAAKIRCHGDYHLGQVLWAGGDFVILDFEGEPTRTIEERCLRQSPLKDVAGMLRSLDYVAHAGLFAFTKDCPQDFARLEPWAAAWQRWTAAAFLREYLATIGDAPLLPRAPGETEALLRIFMLGKAFYELVYELNNRPDWARIPLRGLATLIGQNTRGT